MLLHDAILEVIHNARGKKAQQRQTIAQETARLVVEVAIAHGKVRPENEHNERVRLTGDYHNAYTGSNPKVHLQNRVQDHLKAYGIIEHFKRIKRGGLGRQVLRAAGGSVHAGIGTNGSQVHVVAGGAKGPGLTLFETDVTAPSRSEAPTQPPPSNHDSLTPPTEPAATPNAPTPPIPEWRGAAEQMVETVNSTLAPPTRTTIVATDSRGRLQMRDTTTGRYSRPLTQRDDLRQAQPALTASAAAHFGDASTETRVLAGGLQNIYDGRRGRLDVGAQLVTTTSATAGTTLDHTGPHRGGHVGGELALRYAQYRDETEAGHQVTSVLQSSLGVQGELSTTGVVQSLLQVRAGAHAEGLELVTQHRTPEVPVGDQVCTNTTTLRCGSLGIRARAGVAVPDPRNPSVQALLAQREMGVGAGPGCTMEGRLECRTATDTNEEALEFLRNLTR